MLREGKWQYDLTVMPDCFNVKLRLEGSFQSANDKYPLKTAPGQGDAPGKAPSRSLLVGYKSSTIKDRTYSLLQPTFR